jgi:uncharacterized protein (TIGR02646 family)
MHKLDRGAVSPPKCLARFKHGRDAWKDVGSFKTEIRQSLHMMQGSLCAYCESETAEQDPHIEHFRRRHDYPQLTFEWSNLLLCCNQIESCGHHKDRPGSRYRADDLIDPTHDNPDDFFRFRESGVIDVRPGCTPKQAARAQETLRVLNLDAQGGRLRSLRELALRAWRDRDSSFLDELLALPAVDRREFVQQEIALSASEPFCTVIRHFFEGLCV